jgi:hypothetical protein
MYSTVGSIRDAGFTGFFPIAALWANHSLIPAVKGVYMIVEPFDIYPKFLEKGVGGFFKMKDPNICITDLAGHWIQGCKVLYVGKAGGASSRATLRSRLKQYLDFGKGKPVGHYGGRLIWQLEHHQELLVLWKAMPNSDPREEELQLNENFRKHYGRLPYANLQK